MRPRAFLAGCLLLAACGGAAAPSSKPDSVVHAKVVEQALAACTAPSVSPVPAQAGAPAEAPAAGAEEYLEAALSAYAGNDAKSRELAVADLRVQGEALAPAFAAVLARAKDEPARAAAAVAALGAWGSVAARETLCAALERSSEAWLRARCAFELGRLDDPALQPRLVLRLKYELDGETVLWLADALARQGNLSGLEGLQVLSGRTGDEWLSTTARQKADELAVARGAGFGGELLRRHANGLVSDAGTSPAFECAAWRMIARLALFDLRQVDDARFVLARMEDGVVPLLARALVDENRYVRLHAAQCLERRGPRGRGAHAALVAALGDASIASAAAPALGASEDGRAAAPLAAALRSSPHHETRVACALALERLLLSPPLGTDFVRVGEAQWREQLETAAALDALLRPLATTESAPLDLRQACAQALVASDKGAVAWTLLCDLAVRTDGDPDTALRALRLSLERRATAGEAAAGDVARRLAALQPAGGTIETLAGAKMRRAAQAELARGSPPGS